MQPSWRTYFTPRHLGFFLTLVLVTSFNWSKALMSISSGVLLAPMLWHLWETRSRWRFDQADLYQAAGVVGLLVLLLLSGLYTEQPGEWIRDVRLKLLLLLGPIFALLPRFSPQQYFGLALAFIAAQALVAWASIINFFFHFDYLMERLYHNDSIPSVTSISHIHLGVLLGTSILLAAGLLLQKRCWLGRWERPLLWVLLLLNFVAIHFLTSRTGLVSFYGALGITGLVYLRRTRAWRLGLLGLLVAGAMPLLSYQFIPSFQMRADSSVKDLRKFFAEENRNLTHQSASLRLLAWKAASQIFFQHPLLGVGMGDLEQAMDDHYWDTGGVYLAAEPILNPHNQYLYQAAGGGILALLLFCWTLAWPVGRPGKPGLLTITLVSALAISMAFESSLEREVGVCFYSWIVMMAPHLSEALEET
jgi:O-antigen ligase